MPFFIQFIENIFRYFNSVLSYCFSGVFCITQSVSSAYKLALIELLHDNCNQRIKDKQRKQQDDSVGEKKKTKGREREKKK